MVAVFRSIFCGVLAGGGVSVLLLTVAASAAFVASLETLPGVDEGVSTAACGTIVLVTSVAVGAGVTGC